MASLRGVPNRLECIVMRAEIMADPEDLKAYQGASRDAYCRLSAGEERFLPPTEPGAKRQKTFVLTGDVWQSETIKRSDTGLGPRSLVAARLVAESRAESSSV